VKTIVAPIDFSAVTDRVFEVAASLAEALRGRVVLLHVVQASQVSTEGVTSPEALQAAIAAAEQSAARRLARYEKRLQLDKLNVSKVMLRGVPAPQILEWSVKLRASFLVMGSHGHSVVKGRLFGSTAEDVLSRAPCPVIVVPHPKSNRTRPPWTEASGTRPPVSR
jgi:nucleotide-binding universal stress UspA family protein